MAADTWDTYTYSILCSANDAVFSLWMVFEAEHQSCQCLWLHIRQLIRPNAAYDITGRGAQTTTLAYLKNRLYARCDSPSRSILTHIRLIYPCSGNIDAGRYLTFRLFEFCTAASRKSFMWVALQHYILYAPFLTYFLLCIAAPIAVHHQYVGLYDIQRRQKIQHTVALIDVCLLHVANALNHKQSFLLTIYCLMVLISLNGFVAAYAHIQVTIFCCLPEKFHMSAMQQVVTAADKDFFLF